jgi:hypothetical protein
LPNPLPPSRGLIGGQAAFIHPRPPPFRFRAMAPVGEGRGKEEIQAVFLPGCGQKNGKIYFFLPLLSHIRGEKGAGGLREVPDML